MYDSIDYIIDSYGGATPETQLRIIRAIRAYLNKREEEIEEGLRNSLEGTIWKQIIDRANHI